MIDPYLQFLALDKLATSPSPSRYQVSSTISSSSSSSSSDVFILKKGGEKGGRKGEKEEGIKKKKDTSSSTPHHHQLTRETPPTSVSFRKTHRFPFFSPFPFPSLFPPSLSFPSPQNFPISQPSQHRQHSYPPHSANIYIIYHTPIPSPKKSGSDPRLKIGGSNYYLFRNRERESRFNKLQQHLEPRRSRSRKPPSDCIVRYNFFYRYELRKAAGNICLTLEIEIKVR